MHDMSTDESGGLDRTVNEQPTPHWPLDILRISSLADALKYSAIVSAIIYAGLFLGYRKYYDRLGIRPEDVGINSTFILARSIGFIVLAVIGTGLAVLLTAWFNLVALKQRPWTRRHAIHLAAVGALWAFVSACLVSLDYPHSELAASMSAALTIACVAMAQFSHNSRRDKYIANAGLIVAAITIVLVPVVTAIVSAYRRADLVRQGKNSTAVTILGIPLLDVSAEKVRINWICADPQPPPPFRQSQDKPTDAILVGESGTSYYIHLGDIDDKTQPPSQIVKVFQNCVFLTHDDSRSS